MKRKNSVLKIVLMVVAICLVTCSIIGGTVAWLMTETTPVVNVFTYGNINITLTETTGDTYKMMPGKTLAKDPTLTVEAGSEDCWVFVKIDESRFANLGDYIDYTVDPIWTPLEGADGVYYIVVDASDADQAFNILDGKVVKVKDSVTKTMLEELDNTNYPKLSFTGYAVQRDMSIDAIDSASEAWALISQSGN